MARPNKVIELAQKQRAKAWVKIAVGNYRPSVDIDRPPMYLLDVQGERGDGLVITIPMQLPKQTIDLLPGNKAMEAALQAVVQGLKQLMTWTGCECTLNTECEEHKQQSVH